LKVKALRVAITDRREIEFDLDAVRRAIEWSPRSAQAFGLPQQTPQAVRCNPTDGLLEVTYIDLTSARVFMLGADALGAILISYCHRGAMPVPRHADKAVRIEPEHVVVVFTLHLTNEKQPQQPEGAIGRVPDAARASLRTEAEH
jgi:hypothetical protein